MPADADTSTRLTRTIRINIPLISAPMDTVTESALAIGLAQEGGIGIIHKNLSVAAQTREVDKVKRSENGVISDPVTLPPDETVQTAKKLMEQHHISGVPITVKDSYSTAGLRTTSGAPELADHVPEEDAWPVAALRRAGAVIWAKTNLPIYAGDMQSYNEVFGTTHPADDEATTGKAKAPMGASPG